ncbi:NUDIX hydrolase [Streptomyces spiramenti]|uniref:NUDIX hydrolase n=1 Tax=Streptomyces spiramenti TaxID=2720606 RepID=A0ABX1AUH4_9ACTN|nr:NUDIX hydrolase [Streptomyces spiramenti]NJP67917.1 NUDIX hydrolase [Streptomyces spiramenti]
MGDATTQTSGATAGGQWFPPEWPDRIRALARGEITPPEPRPSATVLLLRDPPPGRETGTAAASGPEVFLLRRRASMAFAGGACAYPGGSVDPRDRTPLTWAGPGPAGWADRLGVDEATAQSVVCAAVRETFEEAGVLLAGRTADDVVCDTTGDDWEADRRALVSRELAFSDFLERRSLVVRDDLLGGWARWITPEFEARRYDTWFFVALLPPGQHSRNASTEADRAGWTAPADALAGYRSGDLLMMPPTVATLRALLPHARAGDVLLAAAGRDLAPVLARARLDGGRVVLSWPGHDEFERTVAATAESPTAAGPPSAATGDRPTPAAPGKDTP